MKIPRPGRKDCGQQPDSKAPTVTRAAADGAVAVGGNVSGIVSTGPNALIVQHVIAAAFDDSTKDSLAAIDSAANLPRLRSRIDMLPTVARPEVQDALTDDPHH